MSTPNAAAVRLLAALRRLPSQRARPLEENDIPQKARDLYLGGWLAECQSAASSADPWLDEVCTVAGAHPIIELLDELYDVGGRACAMAEVARCAVSLQRGDIGAAVHAIARAACLWSCEIRRSNLAALIASGDRLALSVDVAAHDVVDRLIAGQPTWAWPEVLDLAGVFCRPEEPHRSTSLAILSSKASGDREPQLGRLVMGIAGAPPSELTPAVFPSGIWVDPMSMGMTAIVPRVHEQVEIAWRWARNQDSFPLGVHCRWQLLDGKGQRVQTVGECDIAAPAAVLLTYVLRLARRTRRSPRSSAVVAAAFESSGRLAPLAGPVLISGLEADDPRRVVIHPGQEIKTSEVGERSTVHWRTATTVHEAAQEVRPGSAIRVAALVVVTALLIAVGIVVAGDIARSRADAHDRLTFAATLAARSLDVRPTAPDLALKNAIAAARLDPTSPAARSSLLTALYGDARFYSVLRTADRTRTLAVSPDGRWLAAGAETGVVTLFRIDKSQPPHRVQGHSGAVRMLRFSPDSNKLAVVGDSGDLSIADTASATYLSHRSARIGSISAVAFSPASARVAVVGDNGRIATLDSFSSAPRSEPAGGHHDVDALVFLSEDLLAAGDINGTVAVHSLSGGKVVRRWVVLSGVTGLVYERSRNLLYTSEYNGTLTILNQKTGKSTAVDHRFPSGARVMLFGEDLAIDVTNGVVVISTDPNQITDADGLRYAKRGYATRSPVNGLAAVSADGQIVATPSSSGDVLVWRADGPGGPPWKSNELQDLRDVPGTGLRLAATGSVSERGRLSLIKASDGAVVSSVPVPTKSRVASPFVYSQRLAIAAFWESSGSVALIGVRADQLVRLATYPAEHEGARVSAVALDEERGLLLIARGDRLDGVRLDTSAATEETLFRSSSRIVTLEVLPSRGYVLGKINELVLVEPDEQGKVHKSEVSIGFHTAPRMSAISSDAFIASGLDGEVFVYRYADGFWQELRLTSHAGRVADVMLVDDLAVSVGTDNRVLVSTAVDSELLADIHLPGWFYPVALSQVGTAVAAIHFGRANAGITLNLSVPDSLRAACMTGGWEGAQLTVGDVAVDAPPAARDEQLCS